MRKVVVLLAALSIGLFVACDSKNVESSPDSVSLGNVTLKDRITAKEDVDKRIDQVEKSAEKIKRVVQLFKKIKDPSEVFDTYTPIDFVIDVNAELKERIPQPTGDRLTRFGKIEIPIGELSEECKIVETSLDSEVIYANPEAPEESAAIGEKLIYSFKTCSTEGEYLEAVTANWIRDDMEFILNNKNLDRVFSDLLVDGLSKNTSCEMTQDKKIIETLSCENMNVQLSASETAMVSRMNFDNSGHIRFEIKADIYEHGRKKAKASIEVFSDGDIDFDLDKLAAGQEQ